MLCYIQGPMLYDGEYQDDVKHGSGKFVWRAGPADATYIHTL